TPPRESATCDRRASSCWTANCSMPTRCAARPGSLPGRRCNEISFAEGGAMGVPRRVTCVVLAALGMAGLSVSRSGVSAQPPRDVLAWAPMPTAPSKWIAPNRPHWKLSELLEKHKGEPNWTESVVNDTTLRAEYISMAPGAKTPRRLHPDTR